MYQTKEERSQPQRVEYQLPTSSYSPKEGNEVGKLSGNGVSYDEFINEQNEVGRLQIREASQNETKKLSGKFVGLPQFGTETNEQRKPLKEWGSNVQIGSKQGREREWHDGKNIHDSYKIPGDETQSKSIRGVGRLKFDGTGSNTAEVFVGEISKSTRNGNKGEGDGSHDDYDDDKREGALFIHNNEPTSNGNGDIDKSAVIESSDKRPKKKHRCLYLLLLLLLLLVVILGVLLGRKGGEEQVAAAAAGGVLVPPILVVNETDAPSMSLQPSESPTASPSLEPTKSSSESIEMVCQTGLKPFTIKNLVPI